MALTLRVKHAVFSLLSLHLAGCGSEPGPSSGAAGTAGGGGAAAGNPGGGAGAGNAGALGMSGSGLDAGGAGSAGGGAGGANQGGLGGSGVAGASGSSSSAGGDSGPKTVLFDGTGTIADLEKVFEDPFPWTLVDGTIEVLPGGGHLRSTEMFGDMRLHVEFWIPSTPSTNEEQNRGNSGVYLQSRYELQVLDSFNHPLEDTNDCGAFYTIANAASNAALPAETWQTYDITFRQARWSGEAKTENARVTVIWNGTVVHQDLELTKATGGGDDEGPEPGRIMFQDHAHAVRYRNIYVQPLAE